MPVHHQEEIFQPGGGFDTSGIDKALRNMQENHHVPDCMLWKDEKNRPELYRYIRAYDPYTKKEVVHKEKYTPRPLNRPAELGKPKEWVPEDERSKFYYKPKPGEVGVADAMIWWPTTQNVTTKTWEKPQGRNQPGVWKDNHSEHSHKGHGGAEHGAPHGTNHALNAREGQHEHGHCDHHGNCDNCRNGDHHGHGSDHHGHGSDHHGHGSDQHGHGSDHHGHGSDHHGQGSDHHGHGSDHHGHGNDHHGHGSDNHGHGSDHHGHGSDHHEQGQNSYHDARANHGHNVSHPHHNKAGDEVKIEDRYYGYPKAHDFTTPVVHYPFSR